MAVLLGVSEMEAEGNTVYQCWAFVSLQGAKLLIELHFSVG